MKSFTENNKILVLRYPVADLFDTAGNKYTAVVDMRKYRRATFVALMGANTGGTGRVTFSVDACDDATPTTTCKAPISYRLGTAAAPDTLGALTYQATAATGTGSITAAQCASNQHIVEVTAEDLEAASAAHTTVFNATGCRLAWTEDVNDPIVGAIMVILSGARYADADMPIGLLA